LDSAPKDYAAKYLAPSSTALPIAELALKESCIKGCPYCANNSVANGPQMSWDTFQTILASPDLIFHSTLWSRHDYIVLGDGEVTTYHDKATGHGLLDVLNELLNGKGLQAAFTTAGLLPMNRDHNFEVIANLPLLGPSALSRLGITVSFNLLDEKIPVDEYVACMRSTYECLARCVGSQINSILIYDESDPATSREATLAAYNRITVNPSGATEKHHVSRQGRGYASYDPAHGNRASFSCDMPLWMSNPSFGIRHDGRIFPSCGCGFGIRGSSIGNIFENNAAQIFAAYREYVCRFDKEVIHSGDRYIGVCDRHLLWNQHGKPPRSEKPLAIRRCG
jgi:hypothetical protein